MKSCLSQMKLKTQLKFMECGKAVLGGRGSRWGGQVYALAIHVYITKQEKSQVI